MSSYTSSLCIPHIFGPEAWINKQAARARARVDFNHSFCHRRRRLFSSSFTVDFAISQYVTGKLNSSSRSRCSCNGRRQKAPPLSCVSSSVSIAVTSPYADHDINLRSGSVATIKLPNIISALSNYQNLSIRVILTKSATHFLNGQSQEQPTVESLAALPHVDGIYQDKDELGESWTRGAGILHINLRKWAHILVIAPLSANTLAKIVNGMSDNLLTDTIRAWDTSGQLDGMKKRIVVFPAMNVAMWLHPVTAQQIRVLEEDWGVKDGGDENENGEGWFEVFRPIGVCYFFFLSYSICRVTNVYLQKMLACGDIGIGGMREWTEVVSIIEERLALTT